MISFIKFLKVVLPIISVTTATLTTVSLISHKKHDPDAQAKPEEINLDNFVTLNEDFKESIMLYSKDGTGENVTIEDEEKAKKLLEHLKENGSLETFPEFETPEQAAEFLDQLPKAILNNLFKDSKFSQDELRNLDPNTLNNLGRFGKDLRSQQQQTVRGMEGRDSLSSRDIPNVDVSGNPNVPNISGLNGSQMQENLKSMENTAQKASNSAQALQKSGLLKDLGTDSNLQEVAKELVDNLLPSGVPSISDSPSSIQAPQIPDIKVSFEESKHKSEEEGNKEGEKDLSHDNPIKQERQDSELSNEITVDDAENNENIIVENKLQDSKIDNSDLPSNGQDLQVKGDLTSPEAKSTSPLTKSTIETSPSTGGESSSDSTGKKADQLPAQNEVSSDQLHTSRDQIDLKVPPLPDLDLPNVPFDFSALNNVFDAISNLGTGGDADGLSVSELRDWASKLAKTSNSLGNLISRS